MKRYILLALLFIVITPSIALASWWNPFSWFNNWTFSKKEIIPQVQVVNDIESVNTPIQKVFSKPTITSTKTSEISSTSSVNNITTEQEDKKDNKELLPINNLVSTNKKPSLTLLYPNGGEVFKGGNIITIKWLSSNVSNISFPIHLKYYDKDGNYMTDQDLAFFVPADDNQKVIEIPTTLQQSKNVYKVSKYKISIGRVPGDNDDSLPLDVSDGFFTITRPPNIATQYAVPSSNSAELNCTYKYQFGTENPEITFEYGEGSCSLTDINGVTSNCTRSSKVFGSQTYESDPVPISVDTTERLFIQKLNISNLMPNTKYNYQCVVKNSGGQAIGYGNSSPTTYVEFNTLP